MTQSWLFTTTVSDLTFDQAVQLREAIEALVIERYGEDTIGPGGFALLEDDHGTPNDPNA